MSALEAIPLLRGMSAAEVVAALREYHRPRGLAADSIGFAELQVGTGYTRVGQHRIFDFWVMHCWPSEGHARTVYEIKVSRSDFLREIAKPVKRRKALMFSNYFYFATPPGLIRPDELPVECGLYEIQEQPPKGVVRWPTGIGYPKRIVEAPRRDSMPPTWNFVAALLRRIADAEVALAQTRAALLADPYAGAPAAEPGGRKEQNDG